MLPTALQAQVYWYLGLLGRHLEKAKVNGFLYLSWGYMVGAKKQSTVGICLCWVQSSLGEALLQMEASCHLCPELRTTQQDMQRTYSAL